MYLKVTKRRDLKSSQHSKKKKDFKKWGEMQQFVSKEKERMGDSRRKG